MKTSQAVSHSLLLRIHQIVWHKIVTDFSSFTNGLKKIYNPDETLEQRLMCEEAHYVVN